MTINPLDKLHEVARAAGNAISEIEYEKRRFANAHLVGKYFKVVNGTDVETGKKWIEYARVVRMDECGLLYSNTFSIQTNGAVTVTPEKLTYHMQYWDSCRPAEFKREWKKAALAMKEIIA